MDGSQLFYFFCLRFYIRVCLLDWPFVYFVLGSSMYHYISLLYYVLCMLFWTSCVYTCVDEVCKLHIESHIVILHFEISSEWMGLNTQCMQFSSWWFDIPCISPGTVIKSSRFATSKDIITCSNMRPCDDVYTNIYIYIFLLYI